MVARWVQFNVVSCSTWAMGVFVFIVSNSPVVVPISEFTMPPAELEQVKLQEPPAPGLC